MLLTIAHRRSPYSASLCTQGSGLHSTAIEMRQMPARSPVPLRAMSLLLLASVLAACSETSLNEAPIVDLSTQPRAAVVKPPPMAIPAAPGETLYTVKKGDTLFHLASSVGARMQDLARWNGIDEHAPIVVGQQLRLQAPAGSPEAQGNGAVMPASGPEADSGPAAEAVAVPIPLGAGNGVEVRTLDAPPGATAPSAQAAVASPAGSPVMPPVSAAAAPAPGTGPGAYAPAVTPSPSPAPAVTVPAPEAKGSAATMGAAAAGWIWPTSGAVTANFDSARKGIEIAAAEDAPVVAVADGTVSYVGSPRDYGNLIILKHGEELLSVYAHNKTLLVKEGQTVRRGQTIATAGKTPGVPATLHFEVRRNHVPIDPLNMLPLR